MSEREHKATIEQALTDTLDSARAVERERCAQAAESCLHLWLRAVEYATTHEDRDRCSVGVDVARDIARKIRALP